MACPCPRNVTDTTARADIYGIYCFLFARLALDTSRPLKPTLDKCIGDNFLVYQTETLDRPTVERVCREFHQLADHHPISFEIRTDDQMSRNSRSRIAVAGERKLVESLQPSFLNLIRVAELGVEAVDDVEDDPEDDATAVVRNIPDYQIKYLVLIDFFKKMIYQHNLKSFGWDASQQLVRIQGQSHTVELVRTQLLDMLPKISQSIVSVAKTGAFVKMVEICAEAIQQELLARQTAAVWVLDDMGISVYSLSKSTSQDAIDCIDGLVWDSVYPPNTTLDGLEMKLLGSGSWNAKKKQLQEQYSPLEIVEIVSKSKLCLSGLSPMQADVMKEIPLFFMKNVKRTTLFSGVPSRMVFLQKLKKKILQSLRQDLDITLGQFNSDGTVEIMGTRESILLCERRLKQEHDSICRDKYVVEDPAMVQHINKDQDLLETAGLKTDCLVLPHEEEVIVEHATTEPGSGFGNRYSVTLPSGTICEVRRDDITTMECDAIVNAANGLLRHAGGLASAIVKRG